LSRQGRLALTLAANVVIVAAQVVLGLAAHSLGLLADAGHNLTDVAAVGLSLVAVRWATRAATSTRSYGYHRGTILAALANAASILAVTVFIALEAIHRLSHPQPVRGGLVVMVALGAFAVNAAAALLLREGHGGHGHGGHDHGGRRDGGDHAGVEGDLNMRSAVLHMASDAAASLGVAAAGAVILVTGRFLWLDPAVSLGIGVLIAWQAAKLFAASVEVLLESTPAGLDLDGLSAAIAAVDGVEAVHDLHVWSLSSEVRALSAHVVLDGHPTLEDAQEVAGRVKAEIGPRWRIAHATLELECEACGDYDDGCAMGVADGCAMGSIPTTGDRCDQVGPESGRELPHLRDH